MSDTNVVGRIVHQVPHWGRSVAWGVLAAVCAVALLGTSAYLISAASLQPAILTLNAVIVSVRAFAFGRAVFRYLERLDGHDGAFRMMSALRVAVFERLVPLPLRQLRSYRQADIVDTIVEDVDAQQDAVVRVRAPLWVSIGTLFITLLGIATISINAMWWTAICLGIGLVVGAWLPAELGHRALKNIASTRAELDMALDDAVSHQMLYLAYDVADEAQHRVVAADRAYVAAQRRATLMSSMSQGIVLAAVACAVCTALLQDAHDAAWGAFAGPFVAVIVLIPLAMIESMSLASLAIQHAYRVRASAARLEHLIGDVDPMTSEEDHAAPLTAAVTSTGTAPIVTLTNAQIGWDQAVPLTLPIDLALRAGTTTVIEGDSGAGKSTLALSLAGLIPPLGGTWSLLGHAWETVPNAAIRAQITLVEQRPYLFNATVAANLRIARPDADDEALNAVLDQVGLLNTFGHRQGLNTQVGELGARLSGGQAQRLALARALLTASPVVILDEPTASVDPEQADALNIALLRAAREASHHPAVVLLTHHAVPEAFVDQRITVTPRARAGSAGA